MIRKSSNSCPKVVSESSSSAAKVVRTLSEGSSTRYSNVVKNPFKSNPNVIYSLTDEAEAIANACRENGITVTAFCDNEIRKTIKTHCGLEVVYTPDLPKRFLKANFIIANHNLDDCAEQLSDLGYSESYSPLQLLKNYDVSKYSYRISQPYMEKKIENAIKINELYFENTYF